MKKIISIILMLVMVLSFAACGNKPVDDVAGENVENEQVVDNKTDVEEPEKEETTDIKNEDKEDKKPEAKPQDKTEVKPETKPEEKPATEVKPEVKPEAKPEEKPEVKPEPETKKSVGNILLADFKSRAASGSALSIAEALVSNSVIAFSGGAMAVEPGYLNGFDDTEIKGFKEGAMFAPMIGTIPFVGYVFTLEDGADASAFISTLKNSANLRWNICTSADEMVTGSVGNKVFFVMSPISFDEE